MREKSKFACTLEVNRRIKEEERIIKKATFFKKFSLIFIFIIFFISLLSNIFVFNFLSLFFIFLYIASNNKINTIKEKKLLK